MPDDPQELAPEDFYYDGPYLVFTAAYHRKRGYCCNSGCRHCPYANRDETSVHEVAAPGPAASVPADERS